MKLLKRHEKQIPSRFHARRAPFLGFHKLLTRCTQQLLKTTEAFGRTLADAQQRLNEHRGSSEAGASIDLEVLQPKGLGVECAMVLQIRRQLKAGACAAPLASGEAAGHPVAVISWA